MQELWEGPQSFSIALMCLRAVGVYAAGWLMLRVGGNRFLGRRSAFDVVLAFVLGSTLSRAINGSAPLLLTLAAATLLVILHHLLSWISWRSHRWGVLLKGKPQTIIRDGKPLDDALRQHRISAGDLAEALRLNAHLTDASQVQEARFERNGGISVVEKKKEPCILEVRVEEGVQTVRIEIA